MRGILGKLVIVVMWVVVAVSIYNVVVIRTSVSVGSKQEQVEQNDANKQEIQKEIYNELSEKVLSQDVVEDLEQEGKEQEFEAIETDTIRVLLMTSGYQGIYHEKLKLSCNEDFYIQIGQVEYLHSSMEEVTIAADKLQGKSIRIITRNGGQLTLSNIERQDSVTYRGELECFGTEQGIVVVNELPVEQYLYGVVPSEMPAAYPTAALEAQAISARTYTYYHMKNYAYPEWEAHVDDSTAYQVYKNLQENEAVCFAVDSTKGKVITYNGDLIESFYYSTSCGFGAGYEVWGESESRPYLQVKKYTLPDGDEFVECDEAWYRWSCRLDIADVEPLLTRAYEYAGGNADKISIEPAPKSLNALLKDTVIYDIKAEQNETNSLVTAITIETKNYSIHVKTQQLVRNVLAIPGLSVTKQDGSTYQVGELLPSAYFEMEKLYEGKQLMTLVLSGGGMGHGAGMSQNGAKCLANEGFLAEDILKYYYEGVEIEQINENVM